MSGEGVADARLEPRLCNNLLVRGVRSFAQSTSAKWPESWGTVSMHE